MHRACSGVSFPLICKHDPFSVHFAALSNMLISISFLPSVLESSQNYRKCLYKSTGFPTIDFYPYLCSVTVFLADRKSVV